MVGSLAPLPALFVSYAGVLGGAERLLLDVAGGLADTPTLACPPGELADRARSNGLHVIELRERPLELRASLRDRVATPLRIAAHAREVRTLVRHLEPDLLIAWGMRPLLAAAVLRGSRPPLLFQHNDLLPSPLVGRAVRAAARRADAVCAPSESIASDLGVPARVIHPGVDLRRFQPAPPPDGPPEVLVLGAVVDWKRPDVALEAISGLNDLRLRIAGAPLGAAGEQLLQALRERAAEPDLAGRVEFAGPVNAAEALARATCLLHCAEREPFGMVVAEALAAGRPAVVPASCGPAEIVDDSCGRLYPPGDVAAAARAIADVVGAGDLGAAARERAGRLFDVEDPRRRYRALVDDLYSKLETRNSKPERVALVTVTHNSANDLPGLLASAHRHLPGARLVVVDSGSSDSSAALAREAGATVIELGENVGFGRASNAGVAAVDEPVTVLVNPDVELVDDSLAALEPGADELLAPLVLRPDGSRQDSAQTEPGSAAALAIALVPPAAMPGPLRRAACPWTADAPRRVGWAVGCCLVGRTDTLKRLGPFDERIFMYGEDLELGLRAGDQGIETWFRPEARVVHHAAHSTERAFGGEAFELLAEQRHKVVAERRGPRAARKDDLLQALTFADRIVLKTLSGRDTERERRQLRALRR
jgi:GT2 family glycosyltransferase/glycosyltransferase involved in cell wall biosynthesis